MKMIVLLGLVLVLVVGCASFKETLKGITADPEAYMSEANQATNTAKEAMPELPYIFCVGIGYAAAFLRRWYKNIKVSQAKADIIKTS